MMRDASMMYILCLTQTKFYAFASLILQASLMGSAISVVAQVRSIFLLRKFQHTARLHL